MARNKQAAVATAMTVITGYFKYQGRNVESVAEEDGFVAISMKPPRKSKFVTYKFPLSQVPRYQTGEGGKGGAYAVVFRTQSIDDRPIVGEITMGEGFFTVEDANGGEPHVFMAPQAGALLEHSVTLSDDDAEAPVRGKKKPAKKSRRVVDEDDEEGEGDEGDEGETDEDDVDTDDEDDTDDGEGDDEDDAEEAPRRSKKTVGKKLVAKSGNKKTVGKKLVAKIPVKKGKPAPAGKSKARVSNDW